MIRLRELSSEEQKMIERLAHSRTAEARLVERAQMICLASQGFSVPAIARELGLHPQTVRDWLKRFNANGVVVALQPILLNKLPKSLRLP